MTYAPFWQSEGTFKDKSNADRGNIGGIRKGFTTIISFLNP